MRRVAIGLAAVAALTACAISAKYDMAEYTYHLAVYHAANRLQLACGIVDDERHIAGVLNERAEALATYAMFQPDDGTRALARGVVRTVREFRPGGSVAYCGEAAKNISDGAARAAKAIARRPR